MTAVPATAQAPLPRKTVVVVAVGVTQILAWGSTFYLLGVLAPFIARDTNWSYDLIIGGVSLGFLSRGSFLRVWDASLVIGAESRYRGKRSAACRGAFPWSGTEYRRLSCSLDSNRGGHGDWSV